MARRRLSRRQQRQLTRSRLIDAAADVFARRGFHGASVDDVAAEAGFTKGAVYSNFGSKEDLFLAVLDAHVGRRIEQVEHTLTAVETLDDVRAAAREVARLMQGERDLWILVMEFWLHAMRDHRLRRRLAHLYATWRTQVGALLQDRFAELGLPLPAAEADLAGALIALTEGTALQALVERGAIDPDRYADSVALLVAGMAAAGLDIDLDALDRLRPETRA